MILSAAAVFVPRWITAKAQRICQAWFAPTGRLALLAAQKVAPGVDATPAAGDILTDEQYVKMLTAISFHLQQLERENQSLRGLRKAMGEVPVLIPARVVGFDSMNLPSIQIDQGADAGIKEGMPVLATIPLDVLRTEGLDPKLALAAGTIVGTVDYGPGPITARVKLITAMDPKGLSAIIVRFNTTTGRTETIAHVHLEGTAKGKRMKMEADNSTLSAGPVARVRGVQPGDLVIPEDLKKLNLPVPLILGVVEKVTPNTDVRLFDDLVVRPFFQKIALNRVYVLAPEGVPNP